jgi:hypothetical protein
VADPDRTGDAQDRSQSTPADIVGAVIFGPGAGSKSGGPRASTVLPGDVPSPGVGKGLARCWEAASDWLDDLLKAEAAEDAELASRVATYVLGAGVCVAFGNHLYVVRSRRNEDEGPKPTIAG